MACGDRDSGGRPAPLLAGYESHRPMVPGTGSTGRIGVVIEQGLFEVMKVAGGMLGVGAVLAGGVKLT